MSEVHCDYCGRPAKYMDSKHLYSSGKSYGMVYACLPCQAWVGVHKGTDKPLGRLANAELRRLKSKAHAYFDPLWRGGTMRRHQAYRWLSEQMELPPEKTHIGMFDVQQCEKVIEICIKERNLAMSVQDYLSELENDYKAATETGGVPDGRYAVMVKKGEVRENKDKPGYHLFWDMVVMDGQQKGRHIFRRNGMTKESMGFLKGDLAKAGIKMESIGELPELCEAEFPGRLLEVAVITKGEYQNVYINKYAGMGSLDDLPKAAGGEAAGASGADEFTVIEEGEDLPF